jgi:hypothetical protein
MLRTWTTGILLVLSICGRQTNAITIPVVSPSSDVLEAEGITTEAQPLVQRAAAALGTAIDRTGWTVAVDSVKEMAPEALYGQYLQ